MALDIYVGSLTRYYVGNWETPGAKVAREMGADYEIVRPNTETDDHVTDPEIIQDTVLKWRKSLEIGLTKHLASGLPWTEDPNAEYFTDRPSYEGYSSLVLLAAYTECPESPLPEQVLPEWQNDTAFQSVTLAEFKSRFSSLYEVELWLPCRFSFKFKAPDVSGQPVWISSSVTLYEQLKLLNQETYQGQFEIESKNPFDRNARFGLEMFLRLAALSVEHQLPMRLDY